MTLVYIFSNHYAGFADVLACAKARAGCPIVVVDHPEEYPVWAQLVERYEKLGKRWEGMTVARWLLLRQLVAEKKLELPVFCSDWDVLLFSNLSEAYAPFLKYDYSHSVYDGCCSAPYAINRMDPLDALAENIDQCVEGGFADMGSWDIARRKNNFSVGDLFTIQNRTVFDHNITLDNGGKYQRDQEGKRIGWKGGHPYFFLTGGTPILAHSIHCWGPYKTRTSELLKASNEC